MEECLIVKSTGVCVPFDAEHIRASVRRAGGSSNEAEEVIREVRQQIKSGMTTRDVLTLVDRALLKRNHAVATRYGLKQALFRLGPAGFHFEKYLAALLRAIGYETEIPEEFQGGCVKQEVDVVAQKQERSYAIEAKLRQANSAVVDLKIALAGYARYLDLLDGAALQRCPHFDVFWIITNGEFSDRAVKYAACKGMQLTGWNYPKGQGLNTMIDHSGLYPLTIIRELTTKELDAFSAAEIMLCRQLTHEEPEYLARRTGIGQTRIEELIELAAELEPVPLLVHR